MPAQRLLCFAPLACLLVCLPLTGCLAPWLAGWAAPAGAADPFLEEMEALNRDLSRDVEATPDEAAREELWRLRRERAREVFRRHGRRWPGVVTGESGEAPSGPNAATGQERAAPADGGAKHRRQPA
jgi:hypothetical protein